MRDLLDEAGTLDLRGYPLLSYFDDGHPPYPSQKALRQLVEYVRDGAEPPPFEPVEATIGTRRAPPLSSAQDRSTIRSGRT